MVGSISQFDVVIVGAGVVGLAAAALLSEEYSRVALIDGGPFIPWQSDDDYALRVSALNLASIELLSQIEVWQQVLSMRSCAYQSMHVWEQHSDTHIDFNCHDISQPQLGAIVENNVLVTALNNKIKQQRNVQVFNQHNVQQLTAISDSSILLELDDGTRLSADLVIGADGKNSKVRECVGASQSVNNYHQLGLVCTVKTELDHQHTAWQCFTPEGPLALLPLDQHICSVVWSVPDKTCQWLLTLSDEQFSQQLTQAFETRLGNLVVCSERKSFPLQGAQASQYIDHRVVLMGDAAHVVHPLAGLGLNLGLADVQHLSKLLKNSTRPIGSERVLRQYERARKSENMLMQKSLELIDVLFREQRGIAKQMRSIGVNSTNRILPLKLAFMRRASGVAP